MTHAEFLNCLQELLFDTGFSTIGAILVVGAFRRWKWLVDPPLSLAPYYSQAVLRKIFGQTALVYFTYFLGLLFFALGCFATYRDLELCRMYMRPPWHITWP